MKESLFIQFLNQIVLIKDFCVGLWILSVQILFGITCSTDIFLVVIIFLFISIFLFLKALD